MKRRYFRIALACLALAACAAIDARAQEEGEGSGLSGTPAQTATLYSHHVHRDYDRASFSFELGVLGDEKFPERRARYNLRYGGMSPDGSLHWFDVTNGRDARSQLKDLGALNWADVYHTPLLFASATPHDGLMSYSYKEGDVIEISPAGVNIRAVAGHMYVMHVKDSDSDFYVMFRVESLEPKGECTISWKRVPPPDADRPDAGADR
ncbi:MAG TPA: hypothetical protein VN256_23450 [Pyrinomonadaceae bacterium]|nr:hypothetical protein [Pyrinomonadaceae bacterium]